jgi:transposase
MRGLGRALRRNSVHVEHWTSAQARGYHAKKKSFVPTEQLREAVQDRRFAFAEIVAEYPTERLVFIDESGCNVAMTPMYAWAPKGQRACDDKPASWGQNVSVIGAIRHDRVLCHRSYFGAVNTERFLEFSAKTLAPRLRTNDVVILDNLQPHKHPEVRAIVEAQGASLLLLPPYSPDLNPIELLWSFVKHRLRRLKSRTVETLLASIRSSLRRIPTTNFRNWFASCGYVQCK